MFTAKRHPFWPPLVLAALLGDALLEANTCTAQPWVGGKIDIVYLPLSRIELTTVGGSAKWSPIQVLPSSNVAQLWRLNGNWCSWSKSLKVVLSKNFRLKNQCSKVFEAGITDRHDCRNLKRPRILVCSCNGISFSDAKLQGREIMGPRIPPKTTKAQLTPQTLLSDDPS